MSAIIGYLKFVWNEITCDVIQYFALLHKNSLLMLRYFRFLILILAAPVILILLSRFYVEIINMTSQGSSTHVTPVGKFPKCSGFGSRTCKSIRYYPDDVPLLDSVIQNVLQMNDLPSDDFEKFTSVAEIAPFLFLNPNQTQVVVQFTSWPHPQDDKKKIKYVIWYNSTSIIYSSWYRDPIPEMVSTTQRAVDLAIIKTILETETNNAPVKDISGLLNIGIKTFPSVIELTGLNLQILEAANVLLVLPTAIQITYFGCWIMLIYFITLEKEKGLRFILKVMGCKWYLYSMSWITLGLIGVTLTSVIIVGLGRILSINYFVRCDFFVLFFTMEIFGLFVVASAMLLTVIFRTIKSAIIVVSVMTGVYLIIGLLPNNFFIIYYLTSLTNGLPLFPTAAHAKVLADIGLYIYSATLFGQPNVHFGWNDLFKKPSSYPISQVLIYIFDMSPIPSPFDSLLQCFISSIIMFVLYWYLDNVIPNVQGINKPFYFPLLPSYWGITELFRNIQSELSYYIPNTRAIRDYYREKNVTDDDAVFEQMDRSIQQLSNPGQEFNTLRVIALKKTYTSLLHGNSVDALKGVSLVAEKGQVLAVLGHNGAGKTTLISTLVGSVHPTSGTAYVFGRNIKSEIDAVNRSLGLCPQHDILWDNLTAWEHLSLFACIRGVPLLKRRKEIKEILKEVDLYEERNKKAGTFSGGMKRRLSVAVAMIGSPEIVILDEPTSGLDPKSKRQLWDIVHNRKKDKLIILTTHNMDEADRLSDKIAIMAYGTVRCFGNSLYLKERFGAGYNLNVLAASVDKSEQVKQLVNNWFNAAKVVSENSGSIMFALPKVPYKQLIDFIRHMETLSKRGDVTSTGEATSKDASVLLKDFAISQTTLEEVFLSLTKKSNFGFEFSSQ